MVRYETALNPLQEQLAPIDQGLHEYNLAQLGEEVIYNYHKVLVTARDESGRLVGGIHGEMFSDWLHIDTIWVEEQQRGHGIGSGLLRKIEQAASSNGFFGSHTETTSFQALDFYLSNGYQVFGELEGKPAGSTWYYLKKNLRSA